MSYRAGPKNGSREVSPQGLGAKGALLDPARALARVKKVLKLIEEIRDGRHRKEQLVTGRKLLRTKFRQLWRFIDGDEEVRGFA